MVVVTCYLSCSVQRLNPESSSRDVLSTMHAIMTKVCHRAEAEVTSRSNFTPSSQKTYEDKMCVFKYEIAFRYPSHKQSCSVLISSFNDHMKTVPSSTHFYYLAVYPLVNEEELSSYFFDMELKTFSLGFMSNPVKFHTQFDYQQQFMSTTMEHPTATIEEERIMVEFSVSSGQRFTKVAPGAIAAKTEVYRLSIDHKHLCPGFIVNSTYGAVDLCFLTTTPIQLWRTQYDVTGMGRRSFEKTNWIRTCSIISGSAHANQNAFNKETLGGCNALMLRFSPGKDVQSVIDSLYYWCNFNVYHTVLNYVPKEANFPPAPFVQSNSATVDKINWMLAALHSLGYRVRYQLKDQESRDKFMEYVKMFVGKTEDNRRHLFNALSNTYDVVFSDSDKFMHIDRVLLHFLKRPKERDELVLTQQRMIKRIIITPTRVLFQAPCLMHDNRILRAFDPDSAVSCTFQNDDMSGFGTVANSVAFVEEAVGSVLRVGVRVANRHYQFLGCSGSQLRNNGCWLYAEDADGRTVVDIRAWMGSLEHIRNPGTYLSRMGQCFSDTTAAELDWDIDITWDDEDVERGQDPAGKPYCFSDGVGRISEECLREVIMKMPTGEKVPSAFQVRLGGSKGMLSLDKNLTGKTIKVRKSMFKFKCSINKVEVMRRSQPTPLYLNNQIITLLSQIHNGVRDEVFIRLLNNMLHRLANVLLDDEKARTALAQSGFSCCYGKLYRNGFKFTTDPFFKGVLKAITCARINYLKLKTRIEIPHEYGRAMLGVMDEEGVLEYGEVFVQYSADMKEPQASPIVLKGNAVASKMPALHPGDVRKLKAVDKPELHHMVDCIVFPQKGPRPHPNEMAGSDLDGDEYFVTWHPDLIFRGNNETPMDFPSIRKNQLDRPISVDDMVTFIVEYITNDKVGVISNAHLAWADATSIHSQRCKELARIFCHVIDFSKTGYLPEEVKGKNLISLLPEKYPDFMDKHDKVTYQSDKILGKLFRINERIEQAVMTIDKDDTERIKAGTNWSIDQRFCIQGHESFLQLAERLYTIYASFLDEDMKRYGIDSEEELVSGCVIKIKGMYCRSDESYDIEKRLKERMKDVRKLTRKKFNQFLEEAGTDEQHKSQHEMMFAAACYVVTYRDKCEHRSFPWVFHDILLKILQRTTAPGPDGPLVQLTKSIDSIKIEEVNRNFLLNGLRRPVEDGLARIYHLLIHWGNKAKFLRVDYDTYKDVLSVNDFVLLIDEAVERDSDVGTLIDNYCGTGELLCAVFKALTALPDDMRVEGRSLSREAVIDMKRSILLCHHQLARDPTKEKMMVRLQGKRNTTIQVPKPRWENIKHEVGKLVKEYQEKYKISVQFRRKRHGGQIDIKGDEVQVFEFVEFWHNNGPK